MDDRANTVAGWVLAGGIAALGLSIASSMYFKTERPEKMGYVVEGVEDESGGGGEAADKPIAFYLQTADPAKGADVFKKCAACHNADKGGPNALGPNLYGVVGDGVASGRGGFAFSDALKTKGGSWDWQNLSDWLKSPKAFAPGTKMTFAGLSKPEDRANVIAYLNKQSDAPKSMPAAPAEAAPAAGGDKAAAAGGDKAAAPAGDKMAAAGDKSAAPADGGNEAAPAKK
jgi:cytochrome c